MTLHRLDAFWPAPPSRDNARRRPHTPHRGRVKGSLLAAAGALLATAIALPGMASAATVARDGAGTLVYTAAGAAQNRVNVMSDDTGAITFYTSGGDNMDTIAAGCAQSDIWPGEVITCSPAPAVHVDLGDGNDSGVISSEVTVPVTFTGGNGSDQLDGNALANTLDGGPGDDQLNGQEGDDVLLGGDGNDDIQGKDGRDQISGGPGDDLLHPDGYEHANADVVDGGPGVDTIDGDYTSRFSSVEPPVAITLGGGADDGRPGEGDNLVSVERLSLNVGGTLIGSDGPDELRLSQVSTPSVLIGNGGDDNLRAGDGPDRLDGGAGNDTVDGGYGDDTITGGPGRDRIYGDMATGDCGPLWCKYPNGNDTIDAVDGEVDSITCGFGTDTVRADAVDVVDADCETVTRSGASAAAGGAKAGGKGSAATTVRLAITGRQSLAKALRNGLRIKVSNAPRGRLALVARRSKTIVARGSATVPKTGNASVTLRFTTKARRSLRSARTVTLTVTGGRATQKVTLHR